MGHAGPGVRDAVDLGEGIARLASTVVWNHEVKVLWLTYFLISIVLLIS